MEKIKRFLRFALRVDNFNRIIVFVSMCLFIVLPSMYLYCLTDENYTIDVTMPCLLLLGLVLGNGLLVLYRPLRATWLYFFIGIVAFPFIHLSFAYDSVEVNLNENAIFWISYVYCILGFLINLFYIISVLRKRNKGDMDEKTNNDNAYDFLGGEKSNKAVARYLKELSQQGFIGRTGERLKQAKLSRLFRIVSFVINYIIILIYFFINRTISGETQNQLGVILIIAVLLLPIIIVASLLYPVDFKYLYYFNGFFLIILAIIACSRYDMSAIFLILGIIVLGLSFLVTLIVEGRTWSGATPD